MTNSLFSIRNGTALLLKGSNPELLKNTAISCVSGCTYWASWLLVVSQKKTRGCNCKHYKQSEWSFGVVINLMRDWFLFTSNIFFLILWPLYPGIDFWCRAFSRVERCLSPVIGGSPSCSFQEVSSWLVELHLWSFLVHHCLESLAVGLLCMGLNAKGSSSAYKVAFKGIMIIHLALVVLRPKEISVTVNFQRLIDPYTTDVIADERMYWW